MLTKLAYFSKSTTQTCGGSSERRWKSRVEQKWITQHLVRKQSALGQVCVCKNQCNPKSVCAFNFLISYSSEHVPLFIVSVLPTFPHLFPTNTFSFFYLVFSLHFSFYLFNLFISSPFHINSVSLMVSPVCFGSTNSLILTHISFLFLFLETIIHKPFWRVRNRWYKGKLKLKSEYEIALYGQERCERFSIWECVHIDTSLK